MNNRKLASVVEIDTIQPIENSDRLEIATIKEKGWKVVTGKGDFNPGDKAVYFEIDSALPTDDPAFDFLRERCTKTFRDGTTEISVIRIKSMKLRGQLSQGLLMPLSIFQPRWKDPVETGTDLTARLKIQHFDEVAEPFINQKLTKGDALGPRPSFVPKTDEERIQNLTNLFNNEELKNKTFEVTEKFDGSSMSVYCIPEGDKWKIGVCSRNLELKESENSSFWKALKPEYIKSILEFCKETQSNGIVFQGELTGPGINSNRDRYTEYEWHVFRIYCPVTKKFLAPFTARAYCRFLKIPYVRVIDTRQPTFKKYKNIDELLEASEGKTLRGHEREGLVYKMNPDGAECLTEMFSFKAISNRYLLKID